MNIESVKKKKKTQKSTKKFKTGGLLTFATANGSVILSVYVLPAEFKDKDHTTSAFPLYHVERYKRGDWHRLYLFTDTGFMNSQAWNAIMQFYIPLTKQMFPGINSLLLLDKLSS